MTRKKKAEKVTMEMPGTLGGAKVVFPKEEEIWPKVTKGSYSTRTEHKNGTVDFHTDWKALGEHVGEAIKELNAKKQCQVYAEKKSAQNVRLNTEGEGLFVLKVVLIQPEYPPKV